MNLLRVDKLSEDLIDRLRSFFNERKYKVFGVYEEGARVEKDGNIVWKTKSKQCNPHYHFWIESGITNDALKKAMIEPFPEFGKGNRACSNKVPNLRYLCKGPWASLKNGKCTGTRREPMVVINTMEIPEDRIKEEYENFWTQNAQDVEDSKEKKPTFMETVEERWQSSVLREKLFYEVQALRPHRVDAWDVDRMAKQVGIWLIDEFKTLKKIQDLPVNKKYVSHLMLDIIRAEELMSAWLRSNASYF